MEDAISSTRQLLDAFGLWLSHLACMFNTFKYSPTEFGFGEKIPASLQVTHRLNSHMQPLIQLIIELCPLYRDFTAIVQSTLEFLLIPSFPASPPLSNLTPMSQTLQTLKYSICHILQQSRLHMNTMFSISTLDTASAMKLPNIPFDLDSCYSNWLCYFMCINNNLRDLSQLLDKMFSIAANISDGISYIHATHNHTQR